MDLRAALIFIGLCVPFFLLTVAAVVSAAVRNFPSVREKALWLIVASIPFIGFIVYFIFGLRRGRKHPADNSV